jgi:hypothetical protein
MNLKVSLEAAEKEWAEFLKEYDATALLPDENLKSSPDKEERDSYQGQRSNLEKIVRAISKGLVIIENSVVRQILQFPIEDSNGNVLFSELKFDQRWTAKDRQEIYKGLDPSKPHEAMQIQQKLCSKLTGVDFIVLGRLDIRDQKITDQIVSVFFM